jgi:alkylresorcinol/alkylpyrone synthase
MSNIVKIISSCPETRVLQSEVQDHLLKIWPDKSLQIKESFADSSVSSRFFSLPLNYYQDLHDIGKRNIIWKAEAMRLQADNLQKLINESGINFEDIGMLASVTSTGTSVPSLDALMMNKFSFAPDTIRLPMFGLGCAGGISGMNRMNDYLLQYPEKAAILMVTELCSLTFQFGEPNIANMISTATFGDASALVLMAGKNHPSSKNAQFEIILSESIFYPDTEKVMGLEILENGFQIDFREEAASLIKIHLAKNIEKFLAKNKLTRSDINFYLAPPNGASFLESLSEALELSKDKFGLSWESLNDRGNTSAVGVLHVLEQAIASAEIMQGSLGLVLGIGPSFCLELSLIKKL